MTTAQLITAAFAVLCLAGPPWADVTDKAKGSSGPRIIRVDLDKLPPGLAKQLLAELGKGGKDHSKHWHRPYDFSKMPPGIADKMFERLPPGIAGKVLVQDGKGRRYDWTRLPPGIADKVYAELPPGIAKKVAGKGGD